MKAQPPNTITVSGLFGTASGVYTLNGTLNGAPQWTLSGNALRWNGTTWELFSGFGIVSNSSNGNTTTFPCTGWTAGVFGTPSFDFCGTFYTPGAALDFDGINDYAVLPSNATLDVSQFTIETWIKWDRNNPTAVDFICGRGLEQMEIHLGNGTDNTRIRFIPAAGVYLDAPANTMPSGTWVHLACVYNPIAGIAKMYINGNDIPLTNNGSNPLTTPLVNNGVNLVMGCRSLLNYPFKGQMDEFRLWNRALTQTDIRTRMNCEVPTSDCGFVANYHFNQGSVGINNAAVSTLTDASSNNNHATLTNFALTGSTSNWIGTGGVTSGTACLAQLPNTVTVGGFNDIYAAERGAYTLNGTRNGAPRWTNNGNLSTLSWNGTTWEVARANGQRLSESNGSATTFPCVGNWINYGFGIPTFDFCGTFPPVNPPVIYKISPANTSACQGSTNCGDDYFTSNVTVHFAYAPNSGNLALKRGTTVLATKAASELSCATSWTFNNLQFIANGLPFVLTAELDGGVTLTTANLGNAPAPCGAGKIIAINAANLTACSNKNTTCNTDDTFTADMTVTFVSIPTTGTLALSGADIVGTPPSVSVANLTGNTYTFTNVNLRADGNAIDLTATFSSSCTLSNNNLSIAPIGCSNLPNTITVGGFAVCPAETGVYTLNGTLNGAPKWISATDQLNWTGTRWQIILRTNNAILSYSVDGTAQSFPCTGWTNTYGCGIPTFDFCGAVVNPTINSISLANASACQGSTSCGDDYFTANVVVNFAFAQSSGNLTLKRGTTVLATKAASELNCATSWTFDNIQFIANGAPIAALTAQFDNGVTLTTANLGNAPVHCGIGKIVAINAANLTACSNKSTTCNTDDTFTADITVTFGGIPTTGTLALSGADIVGTPPSVSVANLTGNTYTFTNVNLRPDGNAIDLSANFSSGCSLNNPNLGIASVGCDGITPNTITVGGFNGCHPSTLVFTRNGTFNGAPIWIAPVIAPDFRQLYWTGERWEVTQVSIGEIFLFSYSYNGTAQNFPCTGWTNLSVCGTPTFNFCGTPSVINSMSLANVSACQPGGTNCVDDYFTANVRVNFAFAPSTGNLTLKRGTTIIATKAASELSCVTSWTFDNVQFIANGLPIAALTAEFDGGVTFTASNLGNAPAACGFGKITALNASNLTACSNKNTTCNTDDTFSADMTVTFVSIPTTGTLALSGASIVGSPPSVSVANLTGNTYTFTSVNLRLNNAIDLTATFSSGCTFNTNNVGIAPNGCSGPPNAITVGGFTVCPCRNRCLCLKWHTQWRTQMDKCHRPTVLEWLALANYFTVK